MRYQIMINHYQEGYFVTATTRRGEVGRNLKDEKSLLEFLDSLPEKAFKREITYINEIPKETREKIQGIRIEKLGLEDLTHQ